MKKSLFAIALSLFVVFIYSCSDKKESMQWIITTNGVKFYGCPADDEVLYTWKGDSIGGVAHGYGWLFAVSDNGRNIDSSNIHMTYGVMSEKFWITVKSGKWCGKFEENQPVGFGVFNADSTVTIAEYEDGKIKDGHVVIISHNKVVYSGGIKDGLYSGAGIKFDSLGNKLYDGEWKKGKPHGMGKAFKDGFLEYVGEWSEGRYDGKGALYHDGIVTKGTWSKGRLEKSLFSRSIQRISNQLNYIVGNDVDELEDSKFGIGQNAQLIDVQSFVLDTLQNFIYEEANRQIKENVEDRFSLCQLPRMCLQTMFYSDSNRMIYAQDAFLENISSEEMAQKINEKIRYFNEVSSSDVQLDQITLEPIAEYAIVNEQVSEYVLDRELMEFTDLILSAIIEILVAALIGFLIGLIFGGVGSIPGAIIGFIVGLVISFCTTNKACMEIEEKITTEVFDNYMNYINSQDIIGKTLYK